MKLVNLWLYDSGNNTEDLTDQRRLQIRLDWDNDRHMAAEILPPHGLDEVFDALEKINHLILLEDHN